MFKKHKNNRKKRNSRDKRIKPKENKKKPNKINKVLRNKSKLIPNKKVKRNRKINGWIYQMNKHKWMDNL
jgi:hypothetical protein